MKWLITQIGIWASILGIIGFFYTVYVDWSKSKSEITLNRIASINTFELNKATDSLKIYLNDQPIDPQKVNITWEKISIANSGNVDITQNLYDIKGDWGIEVENAEILNMGAIRSEDKYLALNVTPRIGKYNRIILPRVIFERGKSISLELVVKHAAGQNAQYNIFGKIAGIDFKYKDLRNDGNQESIWTKSFFGPPMVQLLRTVGYTLGFAFAIIFTALLFQTLQKTMLFLGRPTRAKEFDRKSLKTGQHVSERALSMLRTIYVNEGEEKIRYLQNTLTSPRLKSRLQMQLARSKKGHPINFTFPPQRTDFGDTWVLEYTASLSSEIEILVEENLITLNDKNLTVDKQLLTLLEDLVGKSNRSLLALMDAGKFHS